MSAHLASVPPKQVTGASVPAASTRPARSAEAVFWPMLNLSAKMALVQTAPLLMSVLVASLIAKHSTHSYAAYALMASFNLPIFIAAASMLQALYYLGGRALGQGRHEDYDAAMLAGFVVASMVALICTGLSLLSSEALALMGIDPELTQAAHGFGVANALGLWPALWMVVFRVHASLRQRAGMASGLYVLGSACGVILAVASMRWWADQPAHASEMAVGAVSLSNWIMAATGLATLLGLQPLRLKVGALRSSVRAAIVQLLSVGWPVGAVVLLDSLMLAFAALVAGRYWPHTVPVHSAAALWVTFALVLPLGIAQAVVQYVAVAHARGDVHERNRRALVAMAMTLTVGVLSCLVFSLAAVPMGALVLGPAAWQADAAQSLRQIMPWAGLVLCLQALIVVGAAILRGLGQTRAPLLQALLGYGLVGIGSQWALAVVQSGGLPGLWQGLTAGFGLTALALCWRCARELDLSTNPGGVHGAAQP